MGVGLGLDYLSMPNHVLNHLTVMVTGMGPIKKPIPILHLKILPVEEFYVQNLIKIDGTDEISIHEPKQASLPLMDA